VGLELEPDKIHTWNMDNKTRMILVPQPEDRLNGVIIFDAQNNPIEAYQRRKRLKHFSGTFPNLWSVDVARGGGGLPEASGMRVLTVRCDRFHDGDSVVLIGDGSAVSIDLVGAMRRWRMC